MKKSYNKTKPVTTSRYARHSFKLLNPDSRYHNSFPGLFGDWMEWRKNGMENVTNEHGS